MQQSLLLCLLSLTAVSFIAVLSYTVTGYAVFLSLCFLSLFLSFCLCSPRRSQIMSGEEPFDSTGRGEELLETPWRVEEVSATLPGPPLSRRVKRKSTGESSHTLKRLRNASNGPCNRELLVVTNSQQQLFGCSRRQAGWRGVEVGL